MVITSVEFHQALLYPCSVNFQCGSKSLSYLDWVSDEFASQFSSFDYYCSHNSGYSFGYLLRSRNFIYFDTVADNFAKDFENFKPTHSDSYQKLNLG